MYNFGLSIGVRKKKYSMLLCFSVKEFNVDHTIYHDKRKGLSNDSPKILRCLHHAVKFLLEKRIYIYRNVLHLFFF